MEEDRKNASKVSRKEGRKDRSGKEKKRKRRGKNEKHHVMWLRIWTLDLNFVSNSFLSLCKFNTFHGSACRFFHVPETFHVLSLKLGWWNPHLHNSVECFTHVKQCSLNKKITRCQTFYYAYDWSTKDRPDENANKQAWVIIIDRILLLPSRLCFVPRGKHKEKSVQFSVMVSLVVGAIDVMKSGSHCCF